VGIIVNYGLQKMWKENRDLF